MTRKSELASVTPVSSVHGALPRTKSAKPILGAKFAPGAKSAPDLTDHDVTQVVSAVVLEFPTKFIAHIADTTDETVKDWRDGSRTPRLATAIRMARKVPKIKAAICELIEAGALNPEHHKLLAVLEDALVGIACTEGEAGESARKALLEYRAMKAGQ
jgi:hypothetical protein